MITCKLIIEVVCEAYGIPSEQLFARRRDPGRVFARHMAWALAHRLTPRSLAEIARAMGGFDHTAIMHGVRKMTKAIETDPEAAENYRSLVSAIEVLHQAGKGAEQLRQRFKDIDPVETADRVLSAPFRDVLPSMEEIRALCMGVLHYATELTKAERDHQPQPVPVRSTLPLDDLTLVKRAIGAWNTLRSQTFTPSERAARASFEEAMRQLQTAFERI